MSFYDSERWFRPQGYSPYGTMANGMMPQVMMPQGMMPQSMMQGQPAGFTTSPSGPSTAQVPSPVPAGTPITPTGIPAPGAFPPGRVEESYVENILRLNLGKTATIYMTFENNSEWNAKIFKGRLEAAGRDHIIISDPSTGKRYLLLTINLDYITFDEELNYFNTPGVPIR